jgi:lipopolysaccharide transport system ATP-binding protein
LSDLALRVEGLGKRFRIGAARPRYKTLRESVQGAVTSAFGRRADPEDATTIWALREVSFDVKRGDVVGVIGRNGAGKSTLLKVLSRITEPTEGRAEVHGRMGSLLEVGTGFHPELSGRDNIYLNGAILGMRKADIDRQLDAIVAFAEVEKFIDTPVKHYSSGMYLRLAFAVAAHLETEILVVDEVLAVGDYQFQEKCLGKMSDVARGGRTVIFVSHNMSAIALLCEKAILLTDGRCEAMGPAGQIVSRYYSSERAACGKFNAAEIGGLGGYRNGLRLLTVSTETRSGQTGSAFSSSEPILIAIEFEAARVSGDLSIGLDIRKATGEMVLRTQQNDSRPEDWPPLRVGRNRVRCEIPKGLLNQGRYFLTLHFSHHCKEWIYHLHDILSWEVRMEHAESPFWASSGDSGRPGVIAPILRWTME